uniref:DUF4371 domain-containing protein n=1 Tax=Iconisemion striatum TaxID=60296 RepID=A0A1A7Z5R3_9TELE
MMATANVSEIVERREYLRRIVAVTSMLGRQGLPFHGHDEGEDSPNRGNFLACIELLKEFELFLQKHNPQSNDQYISPTSQNDMIDCCAQEVTSVIVSEMTKSKVYAIMADEARDEKAEQLAVCVRYVSEGAVKERFLALAEIKSFDAQSIANEIQQQIQNNGLAELKFIETQAKLGLTKTELVQLSNTRWACQLRSISAVLETLSAILECLSVIGSPIAVGLRAKLYKFSAVYALLMFQSILSVTEGLHKFLQKETLDLAEAFICKQAVCDTLKGKHSDAFATELYEKTKALCNTHSIPDPGAKTRHKQRKMEDFVLEVTVGSRTELNNSDTLKRELLFPCVDRMVGELDQRFCSVDAGLLKGIQACSPKSENFLSEPHLNELAKHYRPEKRRGSGGQKLSYPENRGWMSTQKYVVCVQPP